MFNKEIEPVVYEWSRWLTSADRETLHSMDENEIKDSFYRELSFGTGGLRGKLGIGPNRMNTFTVGKAARGLAGYLNAKYARPSVALCFDTRHGSREFVRHTAEVLAANGISSYIFSRPAPTPVLSFAVRELGCSAGVNITASHNTAEYNGFKVYDINGCQITVDAANAIQSYIDAANMFDVAGDIDFEEAMGEGLVRWIPQRIIDRYIEEVLASSVGESCSNLRVVYTPLHGVGLECSSRVLEEIGVAEITYVPEQVIQDGSFPTCPYPNPEVYEALELGVRTCEATSSDLLLATDPDADRVGIAVPSRGSFRLLTGDEVGLLLLDYLCKMALENGRDLAGKVAITTIVSAPMADTIAMEYGIELRRTLTGFKFIGEQIGFLEAQGRVADFLLGFEESYGYLVGNASRDKDGVLASMLICEMTSYWKAKGLSLDEVMDSLYDRYGYWASTQLSVSCEGPSGAESMSAVMSHLRENPPEIIADLIVTDFIDYKVGEVMPAINPSDVNQILPRANVIELRLGAGARMLFRPSGTEPKIKAYLFARGLTRDDANCALESLVAIAKNIMEGNK